jgi:branched-chain amino acid transport system permease protein
VNSLGAGVADLARPVTSAWRQTLGNPDAPFPVRAAGGLVLVAGAYVLLIELLLQGVLGRIDIPFVDISFIEVGSRHAPIPREVFLHGMVIGSLSGLVAMGLILVYRANRIINFSQAQLGAVAASTALVLYAFRGWPYLVVIPIVLVGGALVGGAVEVTLVRRFSKAPRLILTVVTIGIALLLQVMEFLAKKGLLGDEFLESLTQRVETPFTSFAQRVGVLTFTGDHVVTVVVVMLIAVGLGAFFKYTDIGIAVRASAEDGPRASLLGIPVKRVSTIVWILAAVLSAVGVFLRAPLVGLSITGYVGPLLLLYGLTAAVIARMEHMPTAIVAGMGIGIVEQSVVFSRSSPGLVSPVVLIIVVVALLLQRGRLARALETGTSTWQSAREYRPIPAELRDVRTVRRAKSLLYLAIAGLVMLTPWIVGETQIDTASRVAIYSIVGVSLVILTGWTGQISLGQWGFAGVGAAVAGGLVANHNWDFFLTIGAAGLAGALIAVIIGLPALRIQGLFLAVTTLAFAFTVSTFVLHRTWFGWLLPDDNTFADRPNLYGQFDLTEDTDFGLFTVVADAKFFYVCVVFLMISLYLARSLRKNRSGRILIGIRENTRVMQAFGVNLARTRLSAFALSGFIAAMGGALFAYQFGQISPDTFDPQASITIFLMTVIGGASSLAGAVLGAVYILGLPLLPVLRDLEFIELLTSGLGVLLVLMVLPGGLMEGVYMLRDGWLRRVAAREGIHVPSLVADSLVEDDSAHDHALTEAEHHMEEGDAAAASGMIRCPVCEELVPLDDAPEHEHFAAEVTS